MNEDEKNTPIHQAQIDSGSGIFPSRNEPINPEKFPDDDGVGGITEAAEAEVARQIEVDGSIGGSNT
jgi:hypothetical protein